MTQDNIQVDTPKEDTSQVQYNSLEEAVFGGNDIVNEGSNDDTSSAFTSGNEGNTEIAPDIIGQPEVGMQETTQQTQESNDQNRYQYWQSQADKYKNELDALQTQQQQAPATQQAPVKEAEAPVEEFPAAPSKPQQPRSFNREEAYSDPSSESARYMDELEGWRDDINEYNSLKSQYQTAIIEEKFNKMEKSRVDEAKKQQAFQQQAAQEAEIKSHVMGHYGMNETETKDFMSKMSDPSSITIDNLVQLYRLQNGGGSQQLSNSEPSQTFTQTKNAQQVPSPMGVMPSGQSDADSGTFEDKIIDTMIGNFNSKNPWK
tara:strand:+ start:2949 stop:3899 length:951 start_codon:yes stop_codon:yes gene_type:complete